MVYIVLKYYCVLITNSHVLSIALYEFRQYINDTIQEEADCEEAMSFKLDTVMKRERTLRKKHGGGKRKVVQKAANEKTSCSSSSTSDPNVSSSITMITSYSTCLH